jgi:hypothetical protein
MYIILCRPCRAGSTVNRSGNATSVWAQPWENSVMASIQVAFLETASVAPRLEATALP